MAPQPRPRLTLKSAAHSDNWVQPSQLTEKPGDPMVPASIDHHAPEDEGQGGESLVVAQNGEDVGGSQAEEMAPIFDESETNGKAPIATVKDKNEDIATSGDIAQQGGEVCFFPRSSRHFSHLYSTVPRIFYTRSRLLCVNDEHEHAPGTVGPGSQEPQVGHCHREKSPRSDCRQCQGRAGKKRWGEKAEGGRNALANRQFGWQLVVSASAKT